MSSFLLFIDFYLKLDLDYGDRNNFHYFGYYNEKVTKKLK